MKFLSKLAILILLTVTPTLAQAMSLSFTWGDTKSCFDRKSPPMKLSAVPKGTAKLKFNMVDLNAPDFFHGGGTVKYTGQNNLAYGAFRYKGPCPPSRHTYRFTVKAVDNSGKVLATATATQSFVK